MHYGCNARFLLHKIRIIMLLFKINHNHQASDGKSQPGKSKQPMKHAIHIPREPGKAYIDQHA